MREEEEVSTASRLPPDTLQGIKDPPLSFTPDVSNAHSAWTEDPAFNAWIFGGHLGSSPEQDKYKEKYKGAWQVVST